MFYKRELNKTKRGLTKEVDHEAIVVAVDVGGRIRLKLQRDVSHRGVELKVGPSAAVLAQDVGREVIAVIEGQLVILTQIEAVTGKHTHTHKREQMYYSQTHNNL